MVDANKSGLIGAILGKSEIVLCLGNREDVQVGDFYYIPQEADKDGIGAILRVFRVAEKFSLASAEWVHENCPMVSIGIKIFLCDFQ